MPKDRGETEMPDTIKRSEKHAQHIWKETHDSAVETYGEGRRAHMTAFASLKHSYRKEGDHWVPKAAKGPSDPQAARGPTTRTKSTDKNRAKTGGGKDLRGEKLQDWTKHDLYERAQDLDIPGRSKMDKKELVSAVRKHEK